MTVFFLSEKIIFPPVSFAEKDGLLAIGGDLSSRRLLCAYKQGIFPWFCQEEPILWWSPDPRLVLFPRQLHVSKSLKKIIKQNVFEVTFNKAFGEVIEACSNVQRKNNEGTWLVESMIYAYKELHKLGYAISVESWQDKKLIGGLYGVVIGKCFFGESMFTKKNNASKVAFVGLVNKLQELSFDIVDCQVDTNHLKNFGAKQISRKEFIKVLKKSIK